MPPPATPPLRESISSRFYVVFGSILSRFQVATVNRLKIDSKTTEKRLEIDSLRGGGGSLVGGMSREGWAVAENLRHYVYSVCSQFLEGLFAILAECSQFCLRSFS